MQDLFNSRANNPTELTPHPHPRFCPANVSQSITEVTPPVGISLPLNNMGTMPRVVMTMTGARDDDDGCWEKGKPVKDDLSEPVCSNTGICLSLSLFFFSLGAISFASCVSFLFPPLAVFLVKGCVCAGKRMGREKLFKSGKRFRGISSHMLRGRKVKKL